jgi:DNA-binding transcriptional ArsR family regulator
VVAGGEGVGGRRRVAISSPAALLADPTRAAIVLSLIEAGELSPGELARRTGVSASTVSGHLASLADGGLVDYRGLGRHRFYRPGPPSVLAAVEALARIAPAVSAPQVENEGARYARTCYDHLAGRLGVALTHEILGRRYLSRRERGYGLTRWGAEFFRTFGLDLPELGSRRRAFAIPCLDGTERRIHLGGALGSGLASRIFDLGWVAHLPAGRALRVTSSGRAGLKDRFGIEV